MKRNNIEPVAKSSVNYFLNGMRGHNAVREVIDAGNNKFIIKRTKDRPDLTVLVADIYIAGEADIYEISPNYDSIDCIVLIGFYNRYSTAAKAAAKNMNIGLYANREFFGAVNCTGNAFLNYELKEQDN